MCMCIHTYTYSYTSKVHTLHTSSDAKGDLVCTGLSKHFRASRVPRGHQIPGCHRCLPFPCALGAVSHLLQSKDLTSGVRHLVRARSTMALESTSADFELVGRGCFMSTK